MWPIVDDSELAFEKHKTHLRHLQPAILYPMSATNVLGGPLKACSFSPLTGYHRDGCCNTSDDDQGTHVVCAKVTQEFLEYSLKRGNDLVTPRPEYRFAGLKPGDRWCLCALRWKEALLAAGAESHILLRELLPIQCA